MRSSTLLLLASVLHYSLPHSLPKVNSWNIPLRHENRKLLKSELISGYRSNPVHPEHSIRRNSDKHVLVHNRTKQILGDRFRQILNDSHKWRVKQTSDKSVQRGINFEKMLQDKRNSYPDINTSGSRRNAKIRMHSSRQGLSSDIQSSEFENRNNYPVVQNLTSLRITSSVENENSTKNSLLIRKIGSLELTSKTFNETIISEKVTEEKESSGVTKKSYQENKTASHLLENNSNSDINGATITENSSKNYNYKRNNSENSTEEDLSSLDYNFDLETFNLSGFTLERSSLSGILRDLLDKLSNTAGQTDQESVPPCQMWADCRWKLQEVLINPLPSCPCIYPSIIFYDDRIWDQNSQRFHRWKDASQPSERLDVYKPGAKNCVRSIATDLYSIAAQHCCYDSDHRLITRGSGAGGPNLVSPDISPALHYRIDILPWHHCKGDFTRYNAVRPPNNGNNCMENPDEKEYLRQIEAATYF